jgi:muconolactone delta-isomerase
VKKGATKMLYVVNCELKGGYPLPAEQWLEIVAKGMETVMEYQKQGKILLHVGLVGRSAGCMVWNVDSNDELQRLLTAMAFWPFMEWEIIPALSTEKTIESVKQSQAAVRATKK